MTYVSASPTPIGTSTGGDSALGGESRRGLAIHPDIPSGHDEALMPLPLVIRAHMKRGSAICSFGPVHLDNLLAFAIVETALRGRRIADAPQGYAGWHIPLPLRRIWESEQGAPLWASTCFYPAEPAGAAGLSLESSPAVETDTVYAHKRMPNGIHSRPEGRSARLSLNGSTGRWMERRMPFPVTLCGVWEARCLGDAAAIYSLLRTIPFLGKQRGMGLGEVDEWEVIPGGNEAKGAADVRRLLVSETGRLTRPLPVAASQAIFGSDFAVREPPTRIGWTPPQWNRRLWRPGWPAETLVFSDAGSRHGEADGVRAGTSK